MVLGSFTSKIFCYSIGFLLPAYNHYKGLKYNRLSGDGDELKYWLVMIAYLGCEILCDLVVFWFPFYYDIKLIVIIWITSSYTKGATILYSFHLSPFFDSKENELDNHFLQFEQLFKSTFWSIVHYTKDLIQSEIFKIFNTKIVETSTKTNSSTIVSTTVQHGTPDADTVIPDIQDNTNGAERIPIAPTEPITKPTKTRKRRIKNLQE
ncbi:TB2/DP1, HVA22 family-domain-containing protein [Globomyces pollinis-pini]|nr:TB2/DP1, HVA22 family-domain-containing protein [Globomyces pollinis-pini]